MDKLLENAAAPLATMILGISAMLIFRGPLTALLNRIRRVSGGDKGAIEFDAPNEAQQKELQKQGTELHRLQNHPLGPPSVEVAIVEGKILERLNSFADEDDIKKTQRLIRAFAQTILMHDFEVIYRIIFGSQLDLLLAANAGGIAIEAVQQMFDQAKATYPQVHAGGSMEAWLAYPIGVELVERVLGPDRVLIRTKGKEFMQYLVAAGLTTPKSNG